MNGSSAPADPAAIVEELVEEARVEQMQHRVLGAADVLVDGHPALGMLADPTARGRCADRDSADSTTTIRRTCPSCRSRAAPAPPHFGHVVSMNAGSRASGEPSPVIGTSGGSSTGSCVVGHGDFAALLAVDDRNRRAPVALARDEPVAEAVVDLRFARCRALRGARRSLCARARSTCR